MIISGERRLDHSEVHLRIACAAKGLRSLGAGWRAVATMMSNEFAFFFADAGSRERQRDPSYINLRQAALPVRRQVSLAPVIDAFATASSRRSGGTAASGS